jgi:hypothetical protein
LSCISFNGSSKVGKIRIFFGRIDSLSKLVSRKYLSSVTYFSFAETDSSLKKSLVRRQTWKNLGHVLVALINYLSSRPSSDLLIDFFFFFVISEKNNQTTARAKIVFRLLKENLIAFPRRQQFSVFFSVSKEKKSRKKISRTKFVFVANDSGKFVTRNS